MKNLILIPLLIICMSSVGQGLWQWADPYPLTDSTSDNCNPFLFTTYYNYNQAVFLVWEKSTDSVSTEIWMNDLFDGIPPEVILTEPGIHFTHPKIINAHYYPYNDLMFYVLYQTDQNGDQDIYYMIYYTDGTFSDPQSLANMPGDDIHLSVGRDYFFDATATDLNNVAWINDGRLYSRTLIKDNGQYFSDPVLIDSIQCNVPSVSQDGLFGYSERGILYERTDSIGTHLYQAEFTNDGNWLPPEVFYDSTEAKNPTRMAHYGLACWSALIDSNWRVLVDDGDGSIIVYDLICEHAMDPTALGGLIGVDDWFDMAWIAVTYPEGDVDEIFMSGIEWSNTFENFTNSGTMNRNPGFFNGESLNNGCWYDYILWESQRNGHWQIWASKLVQCVGEVDEISADQDKIKIYPNPASNKINIQSDESIDQVRILNMNGKVCYENYPGKERVNIPISGFMDGVYVVELIVEDKVSREKIVIQK